MDQKKKAIDELLKLNIKDRNDLMLHKRKIAKKYGLKIFLNSELLEYYRENIKSELTGKADLLKVLRKRSIRTLSGIAPVAVLTMPYPCPGKCAYCPTEKNVPQSYLSNEPAVMRAIRCNYHPYVQVRDRLRALINNGHEPTKIELIVIGGTWSYLPDQYKFWYIWQCFKSANAFSAKSQKSKVKGQSYNSKLKIDKLRKKLVVEQKKNEKAKYKIIGITLETRPDYINIKELWQMRELGCTRVELGVQAIDDKILKLNKRGSNIEDIALATKKLKNFGFKVTYHMMPGLPGSTPSKDEKMYKQLFSDERFQPDQIKFYPTVVTRGSLLYRWWKEGKYKPYSNKQLENLIIKCKEATPEYVRIIRLIRDIPGESIMAGNIVTNLRQVMADRGVECRCIRCREARDKKFKFSDLKLQVLKYKASGGEEYFISYESKDGKTLFGFCRLRLSARNMWNIANNKSDHVPDLSAALVRELHVYGELVSVGSSRKVQHSGLGKRLMIEAEKIAKINGYKKMFVISGVGVRGYYKKLGYRLENGYMVKLLKLINVL